MISYLTSIVIWFLILLCTCAVLKENIVNNHWVEGVKSRGFGYIIAVCAIPVFRALVWAVLFVMAAIDKHEFEEKYK